MDGKGGNNPWRTAMLTPFLGLWLQFFDTVLDGGGNWFFGLLGRTYRWLWRNQRDILGLGERELAGLFYWICGRCVQ